MPLNAFGAPSTMAILSLGLIFGPDNHRRLWAPLRLSGPTKGNFVPLAADFGVKLIVDIHDINARLLSFLACGNQAWSRQAR